MSDLLCPFFADEDQSDDDEATSPQGSEYSFSMLFRGESQDEQATPSARSPGALSIFSSSPDVTPCRSLFALDAGGAVARSPAARPVAGWFGGTTTVAQNIPPPKKTTTQSVLEAVGLAQPPPPEPGSKSRTRAVLEATGLVSPAPQPKEGTSYF
jgi:hypothetical protein